MTDTQPEPRRTPTRRGLACLDALNFFLADVRDGLGPYLAIYLTSRQHWDPSKVGVAMAAMLVGTIAAQSPAGALIDRIRWKRAAIAIAAIVVAVGCVAMVASPRFLVVIASQGLIGAASSVFAPAIAAITLGMMGHARLAGRTGRNEAFNHLGNVAAAVTAGAAGYFVGYWSIFVLVAVMAALSAATVMTLPEDEIDHDLARGAAEGEAQKAGPESVLELFQDRRILIFTACAVMFHFANAAMLPLVGQKVTQGMDRATAILMSACIITAQLVMIPVAIAAGRFAETWGRKPVFLVGFAVLPIRGLLYTMTANPYALVAIQLLDGIGAGIFGVISVLVVADLTKGTGRFNLAQGVIATATALGAAMSNVASGYIVKAAGFDAGFLALAAIAVAGLVLFAMASPETRDVASHAEAVPIPTAA